VSATGRRAGLGDVAAPVAVLALGCVILLGRSWAATLPPTHQPYALFMSALAIGGLGVSVPLSRPRSVLPNTLVLGIGLLGVAMASLTGLAVGPVVHVPFSAAALPIALLCAVAEEALFRRLAYAALQLGGATIAVLGSSLLFALVHIPLYGWEAFPVDLGAGLLFGWQRWASGTWAVSAASHAWANLLAVALR
jgi:hypothetical protein